MVKKMSEAVWEETPTMNTPINVRSTTDYLLGDAIARRYDLYAPLKGERLLRFFEVLVAAHDAYHEALHDPIRVVRDIHRPPLTDEARDLCRKSCVKLFTEHRSLATVLDLLGDVTFTELRAAANVPTTATPEMWAAVEERLLANPTCTSNSLEETTGASRYVVAAIRELYGMPTLPSARIGAPRMPTDAHDRMVDLIREGKHGTEIASILKQEMNVTISRSLVTKTRQRLTAKGLL